MFSWQTKALALCLLCIAPGLPAQEIPQLVPLDHLWSYEQHGADLGTAWRAPAYDDSGWFQGPAVLAAEDNAVVQPLIKTVLTRTGTNGQYNVIDYFRTRFQLPELRPGHYLSASVLVDDGAVVYLNGTELFRIRMPSGPVAAWTLASETIDIGREGVFVGTNVLATNLQPGENVLAVEVHQPYITSTDVTWGMVLAYAPMEPARISGQPLDIAIEEGDSLVMPVRVTGTLPRLQWWKDGQPLPGQTNASLLFTNVIRSDAGQYFITAFNEVSSVTSRIATLTVVLDHEPPRLMFAHPSQGGALFVQFSEMLDPTSVTNPANYRIVNGDGEAVPILDFFAYGAYSVVLTPATLTPGKNHALFVSNVRDRHGNTIDPNSGVNIVTVVTNVPLESVWKYDDSGLAPDPAWYEAGYDDTHWSSGAAILYNDVNLSLQPPGVKRTLVAVTNAAGSFVTHYFRLRFTNDISLIGASFAFRHYVDDGAAFYLNGRELGRVNLPSGPLSHTTRASTSTSYEGLFTAGFFLSHTNFIPGANVLAVEVHQFSLASPNLPDISFGMELTARAESFIDGPPLVVRPPRELTVRENVAPIFNAEVAGAESVQWLRDGTPLPGATHISHANPPALPPDSGSEFALVASNAFGMVTTHTARLTVIADLTPPRLLSAAMGTNVDRVVLSFSEPLHTSSAAIGKYAITNAAGAPLQILSAELNSASNVVLTTAPRTADERYTLTASGIMDSAYAGNVLTRATLGIEYEQLLLAYEYVWRYDDSGTNFSNAWRDPAFDDSHWPSGPGLLGFEDSRLLPLPIQTMLVPPEFRGPTYFFRTRFNFLGDPTGAVLRLRHIVDDGLVLFLNGQEVHRLRVPLGQNATTVADSPAVPDASIEGPYLISAAPLLNGDNVLAAEVHQQSVNSADVVFGLELVRAFLAAPPGPTSPTLHFEWRNRQFLLSWDAWDFVLECAPMLGGPWSPVRQPTIPYAVALDGPAKFFRLVKGL